MLVGKIGVNSIANDVSMQGFKATGAIAKQSTEKLSVSNFGDETKAGTSQFQKTNEQVEADGAKVTTEKMQDNAKTMADFSQKMGYTPNATLAAMKQSTLDISQ